MLSNSINTLQNFNHDQRINTLHGLLVVFMTTTSVPSSSQSAKPVRVGAIEDRMKSRLEYLQRKAEEKKRLKKEQRLAKVATTETQPPAMRRNNVHI